MEGSQNEYEESSEWFVKYLNRQGDWLEKTRGNLMVAATVIAGMSFQVMFVRRKRGLRYWSTEVPSVVSILDKVAKNRLIMAILVTFMVAAVLCISAAFFFAVALVQSDDQIIIYILMIYLGFWIVFLLVSQLVPLLGWLICFICCCCPRRRRSPRRLLPLAPSPAH
ncbi:unnamed protein product [Brassica rapa subsp. narinosa]